MVNYEIGDRVKVNSFIYNENYDDFKNKILIIIDKTTNGYAYDKTMFPQALYSFKYEDETICPCSLYEYEIEYV